MSIVMVDASVPDYWHFFALKKDLWETVSSMDLIWDAFPGHRKVVKEFISAHVRSKSLDDDDNVFVMLECADALHLLSVLLSSPVSESEQRLADAILDGSAA